VISLEFFVPKMQAARFQEATTCLSYVPKRNKSTFLL